MKATVTKIFEFSASHSQGGRVLGHNYVLRATFHAVEPSAENGLSEKIDNALIKKIHSRDLGEVDFLKNTPPEDLPLLRSFWVVITQATRPAQLESLRLERDRRTQWTLASSGS